MRWLCRRLLGAAAPGAPPVGLRSLWHGLRHGPFWGRVLPRWFSLPRSARIARICTKSAVPNGAPTPSAFLVRLDNDTKRPKEHELSTHWLDFFTPWHGVEHAIKALRLHVGARHADDEYTLKPNTRFVVVDVGKLHREAEYLTPTPTVATCKHTPRFYGDSHSSVFPKPAVSEWPANDDAYRHALAKLLADCSEPKVHT